MTARRKQERAALGFSVHTGWAAAVAVSVGADRSVSILDRRRLEMISGDDPERPRFVYHAAESLPRDAARKLVRESTTLARTSAKAALRRLIEDLQTQDFVVVSSGLPVSGRPLDATFETILASHALIHAAEGELFRGALREASTTLAIPVTEIPAKTLQAHAAQALGMPAARVPQHLVSIGRGAGRPWAKDQKDACLAALIALDATH